MHYATRFVTANTRELLVLILMLALALFLNSGSMGILRGGDEDKGSGIGGTGKTGYWGGDESGIGGTGLKPYLGFNSTTNEVIVLKDAGTFSTVPAPQPISDSAKSELLLTARMSPVKAPVSLAQPVPVNSAAIDISTGLQTEVELNALAYASLSGGTPQAITQAVQNILLEDDQSANRIDAKPEEHDGVLRSIGTDIVSREFTDAANTEGEIQQSVSIKWQALASFLQAENSRHVEKSNDAEIVHSLTQNKDVVSFPERMQRPQLPPINRARPIERISVLPPRVAPMRL
jgi:hypothetical protein